MLRYLKGFRSGLPKFSPEMISHRTVQRTLHGSLVWEQATERGVLRAPSFFFSRISFDSALNRNGYRLQPVCETSSPVLNTFDFRYLNCTPSCAWRSHMGVCSSR